jgi:hypothetical protein
VHTESAGQQTQLIVMKTTPKRSTAQSITNTDNAQPNGIGEDPANKQADLMAFESGEYMRNHDHNKTVCAEMTSSSVTAGADASTDEMQTSAITVRHQE